MPAKKNASPPDPLWLLWLSPFVLLAPVWLAGKALYWGTPSTQFLPWWWQAWLTLRAGEWPLWDPLLGMGAPLIANYQSAIFYPPNWLYFLLAAAGALPLMAWGQAILVAAHLGWAGWGMARLLQKLGLRPLGQLVGGLAFGLCGYLVSRAQFLSINSTLAWLPWVLLAAYEVASEKQGRWPVLKLALLLALQWLAGHAQLSAYTLLLALAWAAFWSRDRKQTAGRLLAAGGLALALSAVQWLPTLEYLLQSARAGQVAPQLAMTYSFWPWRFLGLLAPNVFGSPASGNYAGYGNYWEDAIYIGLLPLFLALLAVFSRPRGTADSSKNLRRFLLGLIVVSVLLALGANTPAFPWLFAHLPGFDLFQAPSRFMIWAVFALAVLAAIGSERWRQPAGRGLYWSRLALAAGLAISLGGLAAGALQAAGRLSIPAAFAAAAVALGLNAMALAALNLWVWRLPAARRAGLVGLVLAADLLAASWGLLPGTSLAFYAPAAERAGLRQQLDAGRLYLPAQAESELKFQHLFRFDTFFSAQPAEIRDSLLPNTNLFEGIASANNFDPLVPARYQMWIDALADSFPTHQIAMLGMMNVSVVEQVDERGQVTFVSVPSLPRTRLVACAQVVASPQAALRALAAIDPRGEVIIEGAPELAGCQAAAGGLATIRQASANRVSISVDGAGWLVLADTWYPGWHAFAGPQELAIYPAYGLFRAVQVPAGVTQVEFVYRPTSFSLGLLLTLIAWPLWVFQWRRAKA